MRKTLRRIHQEAISENLRINKTKKGGSMNRLFYIKKKSALLSENAFCFF